MTKTFCDLCKRYVEKDDDFLDESSGQSFSARRARGTTKMEVEISLSSCENGEHFCINCVIDAVNTLDERKRKAPKSKK